MARAVGAGRGISEALRHLDAHGSGPDGVIVADALARFLVARCESRHAGWRVVRQVVVDSAADAPWERCARRAIPAVSEDLLRISAEDGQTRLVLSSTPPPSAALSRSPATSTTPSCSPTWASTRAR